MNFIAIIASLLPKKKYPVASLIQQQQEIEEMNCRRKAMQYQLMIAQNFLVARKREAVKGFAPTRWWETDIRSTITNYRKEMNRVVS